MTEQQKGTPQYLRIVGLVGAVAMLVGALSLTIVGIGAAASHRRMPAWPVILLGIGVVCWIIVGVARRQAATGGDDR